MRQRKTKRDIERERLAAFQNIAATVHHVHGEYVRECAYCGRKMTRSDVNDYGTLCERCYMREYYGR